MNYRSGGGSSCNRRGHRRRSCRGRHHGRASNRRGHHRNRSRWRYGRRSTQLLNKLAELQNFGIKRLVSGG